MQTLTQMKALNFEQLKFEPIIENEKLFAMCKSCKKILPNTSSIRLQVHRKMCTILQCEFIEFKQTQAERPVHDKNKKNNPWRNKTFSLEAVGVREQSAILHRIVSVKKAETETEESKFNKLLANFFTSCDLPVNFVESINFKNFMNILNPKYANNLPNCEKLSSLITKDIEVRERTELVEKNMQSSVEEKDSTEEKIHESNTSDSDVFEHGTVMYNNYEDINENWCIQKECSDSECEEMFSSSQELRTNTKETKKSLPSSRPLALCYICGKSFLTNSKLLNHLNDHAGLKPYNCDYCEKAFKTRGNLKRHVYCHISEKKFVCDVCGKKFMRRYNLTNHRTLHTNVKRYKCNECGEKFRQSNGLLIHMRIHTGERDYCNLCGKAFLTKTHLIQHQKGVHKLMIEVKHKEIDRINMDELNVTSTKS